MARQRFKVTALSERHSFITLSDRIGLITRSLKRKGRNGKTAAIVAGYFGFNNRSEAQQFVAGLKKYFPRCYCQIRVAERLNTLIEVKVRGFEGLEKFTWTLASKPAIVTTEEAKASIQPPRVEPIRAVQPMKIAPVQIRSNRPLRVAGLSID